METFTLHPCTPNTLVNGAGLKAHPITAGRAAKPLEKEQIMIIVVAALEFDNQADRDHAVSITADVQMATRTEEAGCRDYCFAPDPSVPTRIQVYELWDDSDSLAAHFTHPNYLEMVRLLQGARVRQSINQAYLVERGEPVYGPDGQMKTAFFVD